VTAAEVIEIAKREGAKAAEKVDVVTTDPGRRVLPALFNIGHAKPRMKLGEARLSQ
jgi:uncharacterized protein (DUF39 family)